MALEFMDGFDLYGDVTGLQSQWSTNGSLTMSTSGGRWGQGAVFVDATDESIRRALSNTSDTYLTVGFSLKIDLSTITTQARVFAWNDQVTAGTSSNANAGLQINSDGSWS